MNEWFPLLGEELFWGQKLGKSGNRVTGRAIRTNGPGWGPWTSIGDRTLCCGGGFSRCKLLWSTETLVSSQFCIQCGFQNLYYFSIVPFTFYFVGIPLKIYYSKLNAVFQIHSDQHPINVVDHHLLLWTYMFSSVVTKVINFPGLSDTWLRWSLLSAKTTSYFCLCFHTNHT